MDDVARSLHIIKAALELARTFGMGTIAEGIEDAEIGTRLAALGCSLAQGYHYGKPMRRARCQPGQPNIVALQRSQARLPPRLGQQLSRAFSLFGFLLL
jgi:EAL domain-containing protein (putative c-di-GMP-specific phosphodiesterase class I)